ncbi:Glycine betaine/proline betaine transport system permease protein ProW [Hyphomicrobiales bacterium]|nr:Glycine betaine/proline betaine transport system permease protein ProW [Hyphomicrobiales bacterium]CAH1701281.1 ABC transporter permease subunit [Hyphomicrobiales bacterium]CAI0345244.1 Glycine betaine/proline betaine transport system permease protein ProW [Hyphomicrobiales bacterium]
MTAAFVPDFGKTLQGAVNRAVDAVVTGYGDRLDGIGAVLIAPVRLVEAGLQSIPVPAFVMAVAAGAWLATRRIGFALGMAALPVALLALGVWGEAMQSLALVVVAVLFVVLLGLPLGVAAARLPRLGRMLAPLYDLMQTIPSFVYLIPVAMVLGLGRAPALVATLIYALPPFARLTELGLRGVDPGFTEASRALGLRPRQSFWLVELPLARPTILQGLNQAIMMALAMVVVASMIGAKGLGEIVLLGLQRADPGLGFVGGLAIVLLAVLLDRMAQAVLGRRRDAR